MRVRRIGFRSLTPRIPLLLC
ncbi:hypothetical protein LINGRAHAP2_LOCUS7693 [Linum grandiflorum]